MIKIIQYNTNRSTETHHSVLQQAFEQKVDIVLIQEPQAFILEKQNHYTCNSHPAYHTINYYLF
jgi:hypothetical protein